MVSAEVTLSKFLFVRVVALLLTWNIILSVSCENGYICVSPTEKCLSKIAVKSTLVLH